MTTTREKIAEAMDKVAIWDYDYITNWEEMAQAALDVVLEELTCNESVIGSAHRMREGKCRGNWLRLSGCALQAAADRLRG